MSNDLAKLDEFATALEVVASVELNRGAAGGLPILKLTKGGAWEYGKEGIEPDEKSVWAWNPLSMRHGWVSWGEGIKEGELMVPITAALPKDLPPAPGQPWQKQYSVLLQAVAGDDTGEAVLYVGTSSGLLDAFGDMAKAIIGQIRKGPPSVPLVRLGASHYQHKKYGRIYKPELEVVAWVAPDATPDEISAALAG